MYIIDSIESALKLETTLIVFDRVRKSVENFKIFINEFD